ncbi:MAG: (d)CMP kinase [Hornefia sp.]|nr:(d)CMP kinase [Hornefia sp.]
MDNIVRIAIDGPSGAGKSTIAKAVAQKLGMEYVDTGAMYRAVGYKMKEKNVSSEDLEEVGKVLESTEIDFNDGIIYLDGKDVSGRIRTPEMSQIASVYSALPPVREKLLSVQRDIGHRKSVVMDGRDIGTNVFKDAQHKFFLTATAEERANRRFLELKAKGEDVEYKSILEDIEARDYKDINRKLNPLRKAEDAIEVDSTNMTIEEVVKFILDRIK